MPRPPSKATALAHRRAALAAVRAAACAGPAFRDYLSDGRRTASTLTPDEVHALAARHDAELHQRLAERCS